MVIAALFRRVHVPVDVVMLLFDGTAALVIDADTGGGDDGHLAVIHIHDVAGMAQQGRHVGGDEVLPLAIAQQQRRVLPGSDQAVRRVGTQDAQRVSALHCRQHTGDSLKHVAALAVIPVQ